MDMNKLGKEPKISRRLFSALNLSGKAVDNLTEDVVRANKDKLRKVISFWRAYPDLMLDQIASPKEKFKFFTYQRIFLRMIMRHRYTYCTFPRAFSKSFLAVLCLYVRCMLYPNSKVFIVSGGKERHVAPYYSNIVSKVFELLETPKVSITTVYQNCL